MLVGIPVGVLFFIVMAYTYRDKPNVIPVTLFVTVAIVLFANFLVRHLMTLCAAG